MIDRQDGWTMREGGAMRCPNCRRWTLDQDPHLRGLCKPPEERTPVMKPRALYATPKAGDKDRVREALERGGQITKAIAKEVLRIPERRFRAAISELRTEGYPVIADSEKGSTYRKALDDRDLEDFIAGEIESRITVLSIQAKALRAERRRWLVPVVRADQLELPRSTEGEAP